MLATQGYGYGGAVATYGYGAAVSRLISKVSVAFHSVLERVLVSTCARVRLGERLVDEPLTISRRRSSTREDT